MIYDAFPFFNELELLEIRLHELCKVVDKFVLVEATMTHSGKPKPLYYDENKHKFSEFSSQIIHVVVDDMPFTDVEIRKAISPSDRVWLESGYQFGDQWVRERFQRNAMMRVIQDCNPDDIVIIEDSDELVRKEILADINNIIVDGSNAVKQNFYMGYVNLLCINMPWWGSKILRRKFIHNPSEHRFHTPASKGIKDGGWHFTYLGGIDAVKLKIQSYAHQEFNNPNILGNLETNRDRLVDLLGRDYKYEVVSIDDTYPKYLVENQEKFHSLIYRGKISNADAN